MPALSYRRSDSPWEFRRLAKAAPEYKDGKQVVVRMALALYLDFINLFLMLLRLMGDRR